MMFFADENQPSCCCSLPSPRQWRTFVMVSSITALIAGILGVIFYGVLPDQGAWAGYPESMEGLCEQFCESSDQCHLTMAERPPLFQPVNAWSGLSFVFFGLWPIINRFDISTVVFLFGNVYLGTGSFMFHANLAEFWGDVDVAGIIALLGATACHGLHSVYGISWRWMVLPIVILTLCTNFFYPQMKSIGLYVEVQMWCFQAIMVWCTLRLLVARIRLLLKLRRMDNANTNKKASASTSSSQPPYYCFAILKSVLFATFPGILFLIATGIWLMENAKVICSPNSLFQGHAIWHIFSAISVFINWQFVDQNRLDEILQHQRETEAMMIGTDVLEMTDRTLEFSDDSEEVVILPAIIVSSNSSGGRRPRVHHHNFGGLSRYDSSTAVCGDVEFGLTSDESSETLEDDDDGSVEPSSDDDMNDADGSPCGSDDLSV